MPKPLNAAMDNLHAARLADAAIAAMAETSIGDQIDRGLVLLRELNARGFDVVARCPHDTDGDGNCPLHPRGCP